MQIRSLNESSRNYVRSCWLTAIAGLHDDAPSHTSARQAPLVRRAPEGPEGQAAVPVGGGGAWPGFEPTRRAKLAARTARGRAAAHGHTKQPGPAGLAARTARGRAAAHGHTKQPGPAGLAARTACGRPGPPVPGRPWGHKQLGPTCLAAAGDLAASRTKSGGPQENLGATTHAFTCVN